VFSSQFGQKPLFGSVDQAPTIHADTMNESCMFKSLRIG
jgi:hypothetical protein